MRQRKLLVKAPFFSHPGDSFELKEKFFWPRNNMYEARFSPVSSSFAREAFAQL